MSFLGFPTDFQYDNIKEIEKEVKNDCRLSSSMLSRDYKVVKNIEENPVWYFYDPPIRVKESVDVGVNGGLNIDSNDYLKPNVEQQLKYIEQKNWNNFKNFRSKREGVRNDCNEINLKNLKRKNVFEKAFSPSMVIHNFSENHPMDVLKSLDLLEQNNYGDSGEIQNIVKKCKSIRDEMVTKRRAALEALEKILNSQIETFENDILTPLEQRLNALRNVDDMEMKKKLERRVIHYKSCSSSSFKKLIDLCVDSFSVILSFLSTREILSGIYPTCSFFSNLVHKLPLDFKVSSNQFNRFDIPKYLQNFTIRKFQLGDAEDNVIRMGTKDIVRRDQLLNLLRNHCRQIRDLQLNGLSGIRFRLQKGNFDTDAELKMREDQNEEIFSIALKCPFLERLANEYLPSVQNMSLHLKFLKRLEYSLKIPAMKLGQRYNTALDLVKWGCLRQLKGYFESEERVHLRELILHSFDSSFFTKDRLHDGTLPFSLLRKLYDSVASSCPSLQAFQARIFVGFPCCSEKFLEYVSKVPKVLLFLHPKEIDIGDKNKSKFSGHYFDNQHMAKQNLFRTSMRERGTMRFGRDNRSWKDVNRVETEEVKNETKTPLEDEETRRKRNEIWEKCRERAKKRSKEMRRKVREIEQIEYEKVSKLEKNGDFSSENVVKKIRTLGNFMSINRSKFPESAEKNYFLFVSHLHVIDPKKKKKKKESRNWDNVRYSKHPDDSDEEEEEKPVISVTCMDGNKFIYEVLRNVPYCRYSSFFGIDCVVRIRKRNNTTDADDFFVNNLRMMPTVRNTVQTPSEINEVVEEINPCERRQRLTVSRIDVEEEDDDDDETVSSTKFTKHLQSLNNLISSGFYFVLFFSDQRGVRRVMSDPYGIPATYKALRQSLREYLIEKQNVKFLHFFLNYERRGFFGQNFRHPSEEEAKKFDAEKGVKSLDEMLKTRLICYMPQIILKVVSEKIEVTSLEILRLQLVFKKRSMVRTEDLKSLIVHHVIPFLVRNRKERINSNLKKFHLEVICEDLFPSSSSKFHKFEKVKHGSNRSGRGVYVGMRGGRREEGVETKYFLRVRKLKGHEEEAEREVQLFFDSVKKIFSGCGRRRDLNWERFRVHFDLRFNQGKGRRRMKMKF